MGTVLNAQKNKEDVEKDEEAKNDMVTIHLYDIVDDHTATSDWYIVNCRTGKVTDVLNQEIDISPEGIIQLAKNITINEIEICTDDYIDVMVANEVPGDYSIQKDDLASGNVDILGSITFTLEYDRD